jgi:hypothetical protein
MVRITAARFGLGHRSRVQAIPHGRQAIGHICKGRGHIVRDIKTGKELRPDDAADAAHIGAVHVQQLAKASNSRKQWA